MSVLLWHKTAAEWTTGECGCFNPEPSAIFAFLKKWYSHSLFIRAHVSCALNFSRQHKVCHTIFMHNIKETDALSSFTNVPNHFSHKKTMSSGSPGCKNLPIFTFYVHYEPPPSNISWILFFLSSAAKEIWRNTAKVY